MSGGGLGKRRGRLGGILGALALPWLMGPSCGGPDTQETPPDGTAAALVAPESPEAPQGVKLAVGPDDAAGDAADDTANREKPEVPPLAPETAPPERGRAKDAPQLEPLRAKIATYFSGNVGRRVYVQVDRPLYRPGETIWVKTWNLKSADLEGRPEARSITYELVSPKGAVVVRKQVQESLGTATNDFELPEESPGGEYLVRARANDGITGERPVVVMAYEAPRLKQKLEFVRRAHGPGEEVRATIEVHRATGAPLADHPLRAVVTLDGERLPEVALRTDARGNGLVRFKLPVSIARGDGLLTVLAEDGGVTESISRRVPIVINALDLSFYPEGGDLVAGLESRVYLQARSPLGKPADVRGRIVDDMGREAAAYESHDKGLGRFAFTPQAGRTYHAVVDSPSGISGKYPLPNATPDGCVLRTYDDPDGQRLELPVAVRCATPREVVVAAVLRERLFDAVALKADPEGAVAVLRAGKPELAGAMGVLRITVFDPEMQPLAERVVFRNRRRGLKVELVPDRGGYAPRDAVALAVRTTDDEGRPVAAELALAVVDDTAIRFADDKHGHLLSKILLEPEVPGDVEEPNFYFDRTEAKAALALEMLMGTRGWRRFEWATALNPPEPLVMAEEFGAAGLGLAGVGRGGGGLREGRGFGRGAGDLARRNQPAPPVARPRPMAPRRAGAASPLPAVKVRAARPARAARRAPQEAKPMPPPPPARPAAGAVARGPMAPPAQMAKRRKMVERQAPAEQDMPAQDALADKEWDRAARRADIASGEAVAPGPAPVRVFPAPKYDGPPPTVRSDFRDTVHWAPTVRTDGEGKATVDFYLSDAVTSFRVYAEGVGGGRPGRAEKVIESKLPFSMGVQLPLEVSEGDEFELPLTLSNERPMPLEVTVNGSAGELLTAGKPMTVGAGKLEAKARFTHHFPVKVTGHRGQSEVRFVAEAGGLRDEFVRTVRVEPRGFPQLIEASGELQPKTPRTVDLSKASPGSVDAQLTVYASPVATLVGGLEGMIREPGGCFEQTSSSNYPNIMVLRYLQAHDEAEPALVARTSQMLDRGYKRLVGYETKQNGFEWFGAAPGHEALTAYGVLQFLDLKAVYGGVDSAMVDRTVAWLKARADGKGGFQRNAKALDSFGRASPEVTDAYITYAIADAGLAKQFPKEIAEQARRAESTKDAYLLALAANTFLAIPEQAELGGRLATRLAGMQADDGAWRGADHSITRSGGNNLEIETTSLAVLALLRANSNADRVRKAVEWLGTNRSGYGRWGATQATVLALKAMTLYAEQSRKTPSSGRVEVWIGGEQVAAADYEAGRREPLVIRGWGDRLALGANEVEIRHKGEGKLPYTLAVDYRSDTPDSHPDTVVGLDVKLSASKIKVGETTRLTATVTNRTQNGQPMTLARLGLPGGLTFQQWQLKELREKGLIAFAETGAREVILYFRQLEPGEVKEIHLDLVARVPGRFRAPSSATYLYYTDEQKTWAEGLEVSVVN